MYYQKKIHNKEIGIIYLITSLSTIIPITLIFSQNNFYSEPRTTLFFLYFSAVGLMFVIKPIFKTKILQKKYKNILYVLISFILIISIISDINLAINIKKQLDTRDITIKTEYKNTVYTVESIKGKIPDTLHFNDIINNENHWVNNCVANYYKIPKIKVNNIQ